MKTGEQVGKNIKKRREELGMTQDELAKKCGYQSKSSISKIEKGETDLNQTKLSIIAKALQTTPGALFNLTGKENDDVFNQVSQSISSALNENKQQIFSNSGMNNLINNIVNSALERAKEEMQDREEELLDDEQKLKLRLSYNLNLLMEQDNINNSTLAKMIGVSESAVGKWLSGSVMPRPNVQLRIADFFGVNREDLFDKPSHFVKRNKGLAQNPHIKSHRYPLLGTIAAGVPILADEHIDDYITLSLDVKADFALRVQGDSMIDANIYDGDIVFIHQQPTVENGEIAAVMLIDPITSDGVATLKRVYKTADGLQLVPENRNYPPIIINKDNGEGAKILGKATYYLTRAR